MTPRAQRNIWRVIAFLLAPLYVFMGGHRGASEWVRDVFGD